MCQSKLVKHKFTEKLNEKELCYRETIQPHEDEFNDISKWITRMDDGRQNTIHKFCGLAEIKGEILELGAGSCWFSSILSRLEAVKQIYCLDMSEFILKNVAPYIMKYLKADCEKIIRVIGDFNKLHFQNEKFDYVVFDASLHHIPVDDFSSVLKEVYRVLKVDGKVVALREPFLGHIPLFNKYVKNIFGSHEKSHGVTEHIFTKNEWANILRSAGFKCSFIPHFDYEFKIDNKLSMKSVIKKLIKHTPLKKVFFILFPMYYIVLKK